MSAGLEGAIVGAVSGALAHNITNVWFGGQGAIAKSGFARRLAHGVSQGALSDAQGQSFRSGFAGGFAGGASPNVDNVAADVVLTSLAGGAVAELGGGEFKDGARSAAFQRLFEYVDVLIVTK